jgi:hypothetical protein
MKLTGEYRSTGGKTCPTDNLSTTNPTLIDGGSNPCLRGERPAANHLSHDTAHEYIANGSVFSNTCRCVNMKMCYQLAHCLIQHAVQCLCYKGHEACAARVPRVLSDCPCRVWIRKSKLLCYMEI